MERRKGERRKSGWCVECATEAEAEEAVVVEDEEEFFLESAARTLLYEVMMLYNRPSAPNTMNDSFSGRSGS